MTYITNYDRDGLVVFGKAISDYLIEKKQVTILGICEKGYVFKRTKKLNDIIEMSDSHIKMLIWLEGRYWGGENEKTNI